MGSIVNNIISAITELFSKLFSSIDNSVYSALDNISFIDNKIINSSYFEKLLGTSSASGILVIANALLIGFILFFAVRYFLSNLSIGQAEHPYKFILKFIIVGICMNCSFFICEQIINLNSFFSTAIRDVGSNFLDTEISFTKLSELIDSIITIDGEENSVISIDGVIKTISSIGFLNLIFIYSVRYILIKVFVLLSPFAFLCASNSASMGIFKSWLKCFISLLLLEIFSSLILIIMFSIKYSANDLVSKLLFLGSLLALIKSSSIMKEILGGLSMDLQGYTYYFKGLGNFK